MSLLQSSPVMDLAAQVPTRHLGTFVSAGSFLTSIPGLSSFSLKLNLKAPVTVWRLGNFRNFAVKGS